MRIQEENIDSLKIDSPSAKFVRPTGEVEVLRPIAGPSRPARRKRLGLSEFHRSLVSVGTFAVVVMVLVTGVHFTLFGPPVDPVGLSDLARDIKPDGALENEDVPYIVSDAPPDEGWPGEIVEDPALPVRAAKRPAYRMTAVRTSFRRRQLPAPQYWVSQFVPSTLVIYVENGEIRSRTESRASGIFKKS